MDSFGDGMSLATGRYACFLVTQGLERAGSQELRLFAEACFRFTSQIALRPGEAVFLEIGRSSRLFSEAGFRRRLERLARAFGLQGRIAIADDPPTALALARFPSCSGKRDLPLEALRDYAHPFFGDSDVLKKVARAIEIFRALGMRRIGDFLAIPPSGMASRFGREAVEFSARVHGTLQTAWPEFRPIEKVLERKAIESPEGLEALLFTIKELLDRCFARLFGRGERASVVSVSFTLENWSTLKSRTRQWRLELPLPQGSAAGVLPILRERMDRDLERERLVAPVEAVSVEITETVPGRGGQHDFFSKREQEEEAWNALASRLSDRLGKDRVFVALPAERYLPEKAWVRGLQGLSAGGASDAALAPTLIAERPTRLLGRPEPLRKIESALFTSDGRKWRALSWDGPERLSGEWWKPEWPWLEGFSRDYYRVRTEKGEQLWVFAVRKLPGTEPELYLHGFFD